MTAVRNWLHFIQLGWEIPLNSVIMIGTVDTIEFSWQGTHRVGQTYQGSELFQ